MTTRDIFDFICEKRDFVPALFNTRAGGRSIRTTADPGCGKVVQGARRKTRQDLQGFGHFRRQKFRRQKGAVSIVDDLARADVPKFLLIEDVDRISRMLPLDSLDLISKILDFGVTIISLRDNQVLSQKNWQSSQSFLILSLKTTLANEERQKRIFRGKANWKQKRLETATKIYTRKVPGWLTVKDDKIVKIPEHVATVKKLFKLSSEGIGMVTIIRAPATVGGGLLARSLTKRPPPHHRCAWRELGKFSKPSIRIQMLTFCNMLIFDYKSLFASTSKPTAFSSFKSSNFHAPELSKGLKSTPA